MKFNHTRGNEVALPSTSNISTDCFSKRQSGQQPLSHSYYNKPQIMPTRVKAKSSLLPSALFLLTVIRSERLHAHAVCSLGEILCCAERNTIHLRNTCVRAHVLTRVQPLIYLSCQRVVRLLFLRLLSIERKRMANKQLRELTPQSLRAHC